MRYRFWVGIGAGMLLGLILAVAGIGKILGENETFKIFLTLPKVLSIPTLAEAASTWLPRVELIVGLLLIIGVAAKLMGFLSLALTAAFIGNNSWLLSQGLGYEPCTCFGVADRIFQGTLSTTGALYVDIGMLALAMIIILFYPGKLLTIRPLFLKPRKEAD